MELWRKSARNLKNFPPPVLLFLLLVTAISCHKQPVDTADNGKGVDTGDEKTAAEEVAEADQLYAQRADISKLRMAITLLRQARVADYGSYEAAWKLAKFDYYLASHTTDDRERDMAFHEGIDVGKIAVQLHDDKPDGHFWLGANYGGSAEHSTLAGLANVEDIKREMERTLKIDEGYQDGSAYLGLGSLYLQSPRVLGGDSQKAIEYLEKGLRFGSNNALLRLRLAEAYYAAKRNGDAQKQIDYIKKMTPDQNYLPEYKDAVDGADKLAEKIKQGTLK